MADEPFTIFGKRLAGGGALSPRVMQMLHQPGDPAPYIPDRALAEEALALIARHGAAAWREVAARARDSRIRGNIVQFCRLRQLERLIAALDDRPAQPH